jgi:hypothetical protein
MDINKEKKMNLGNMLEKDSKIIYFHFSIDWVGSISSTPFNPHIAMIYLIGN